MPVDVSSRDTAVVTPVRTHRRRGIVLLGLAAFQFWLWGTRIYNLLQDTGDVSAAFVTVHLVLYVSAIAAGVVLLVLGWRMVAEARKPTHR